MALLYLIRHPHTKLDLARPSTDWDLSETGRAQIAVLLDAPCWPHVRAVYASAEHKAMIPAEMAATRYGLTWRPVATLGEVDRRAYVAPDQASYEAAVAAFFARPEASPFGWETAAAALSRFRTALEGLLARHAPEESLAIVSHGLVLSLYEAHLRGEPPSLERWRALPFCAIAAVERGLLKPVTGFLAAPYAGLPVPEGA